MKKELTAKKNKAKFIVSALTLGLGSSAFAGGVEDGAFEDLFNTFKEWLSGSLGKLLALLGFIGTFIIYLMTHKGSVLFIGVIISLIAGGIVGISQTFFTIGEGAFQNPEGT